MTDGYIQGGRGRGVGCLWGVGCRKSAYGVGLAYRVETAPLLSGIARFSLSLVKKQIVFFALVRPIVSVFGLAHAR
jgi:hypothetical protein